MISAKATTEQRIKGHIGQPAACMIESKAFSGGGSGAFRYAHQARRRQAACAWRCGLWPMGRGYSEPGWLASN